MKHGKNMSNIEMVKSMLKGERPFLQVGYTGDEGKYIIRKVGERWTDAHGKHWIQKEYGPQTETPVMDIIREEMKRKCSKCGKDIVWGTRQDEKMHAKTGICFDCQIALETDLKVKGLYPAYEKQKMLNNELSYLKEVKKYLSESKIYLEEHDVFTYVNSNGLVEQWDNVARDDVLKNIKKDFVRCLKEIKRVEKDLKQVAEELKGVQLPEKISDEPTPAHTAA